MLKATLYFLAGAAIIILLLMGGCYGAGRYIVSHKTCEQYNIDNYELRTHTDIPQTKNVTCVYDSATLTKSSVFELDVTEEKLVSNIAYNKLKKATAETLPLFTHNPAWNDSIRQLPIQHLYYKAGSYKNDKWVYVLDSVNQTFWAELSES